MRFSVAVTGAYDISLPQWGRCFWQDPSDGELFLAFASGTDEVFYTTSPDSGNSWTTPSPLFPVDDFSVHNNFDTFMDRRGHIHCGFRYNDSGCYQLLGKSGGGGWTLSSGSGPLGFNIAGDSGIVKGFDGSLVVQDSRNFFAELGSSVKFPAVKIAAKASGDAVFGYILGDPFTGTPTVEPISSFDNGSFVGSGGGFPTINVNAVNDVNGAGKTSEFVVYNDRTHQIRGFKKNFGPTYADDLSVFFTLQSGDIPYGTNMAFGSGYGINGSDGVQLVATASGQSFYMAGGFGYQQVTTSYNSDLFSPPDTNINTFGTDVQTWRKVPRLNSTPSGQGLWLPMETGVVPTGSIYGVGRNDFVASGVPIFDFPGGGTNCDFTINENEELIFYFQTKNQEGKQSIARFKAEHDFNDARWVWPNNAHPESGIRFVAPVNSQLAGGFSNILFWEKFKALKHPSEPGDGSNKAELLVTQSHLPVYPSGGALTVWNISEAVDVISPYSKPTYHTDYVKTSGSSDIEVFKQISKLEGFFFTSHKQQANNIFDNDLNTFGNLRNGYVVEIELDKAREISRLEFLSGTLSRPPEVTISGSFDRINWSRVLTKPSGRLQQGFNENSPLYKFSTNSESIVSRENSPDSQPVNIIDPFVAKWIRFTFENEFGQNVSSSMYDIRLFGPGQTEPEFIRYSHDNNANPHDIRTLFLRKNQARRTESFDKYQQGDLPADFRTYGDFEWRVVGSGKSVKTRSSPNAPPQQGEDGLIPANSGIWGYYGHKRGYKDGFSLRSEAIGDASGLGSPIGNVPIGGIQPGHSGVVEVDVFLTNEDVSAIASAANRKISFRLRTDTQKNDRVEFWTIAPSFSDSDNRIPTLRQTWEEANNWDSDEFGAGFPNYPEYKFNLANSWGRHTLRWVYYKGAYDSLAEQTNSPNFGTAWIDQVSGLDASPTNYVKGYMRGENGFASGAIHSYMQGKGGQNVHGFLLGVPQDSSIHGYLISAIDADAFSQINGYVLPATESIIHGFTLGGSGLTTFPTGAIHGYIAVPPSGGGFTSHGYVEGDWGQNIHGYLRGFGLFGSSGAPGVDATGDQSIHGFVYGVDAFSSIHGILNNTPLFETTSTHGYLNSSFGIGDQVIHGYLFSPSGFNDDIRGVTLGWNQGPDFFRAPQSMIYGIVKTPVAETSGQVHGYMIANFPVSNILGYMGNQALVPSGGGTIAGGPGGPGGSTSNVIPGTNWINGFISATGNEQLIHGYLLGPPGGFAQRKGYVLAGATDDRIYGYSISHETVTTEVHGYMSGVPFSSKSIYGITAGSSGLLSTKIHGYMEAVLLEDDFVWGHMIGFESGSILTSSAGLCLNHNFPLSVVPTITLPSSYFS